MDWAGLGTADLGGKGSEEEEEDRGYKTKKQKWTEKQSTFSCTQGLSLNVFCCHDKKDEGEVVRVRQVDGEGEDGAVKWAQSGRRGLGIRVDKTRTRQTSQ